jgi:chromosomal replication initiator protein
MKYKELLTWLKENGYLPNLDIDVLLKLYLNSELPTKTPEQIIKLIGILEEVPDDYATQKNKKIEIVTARQIAITLIKCNIRLSLNDIGYLFNKNHATIIHSHKVIDNLLATDKEFRIKFNNYLKYLNLKYVKYGKT